MSLKKETIAKYARTLRALGCSFKIIEDDGTEHGDLSVVSARTKAPRSDVIGQVDYKAALEKLGVGELVELHVPPSLRGASLQSSVSACAYKLYGKGSVTSSFNRKRNTLEVLRLQ